MKETYLPKHMRIGFVNRIIRFFLGPLSILGLLCLLNYKPEFKETSDLCQRRDQCYANCVNDNFPDLYCKEEHVKLTYEGNLYQHFFFYPYKNTTLYQDCLSYVSEVSTSCMVMGV